MLLKMGSKPPMIASHLVGIMISKTIGFFGVHNIFRHTHISIETLNISELLLIYELIIDTIDCGYWITIDFWMTESNDLRKFPSFSALVQLQSRPGWLGAAFHTTSIPTCTCWEGPASTVPHRILKHLVSRCVSIPFGRCKLLPVSFVAELKWTWSGWLSFGKSSAWTFSRHLRLRISTENSKEFQRHSCFIVCPCSSHLNSSKTDWMERPEPFFSIGLPLFGGSYGCYSSIM